MEFAFSDEEERFREELRAFLRAELPAWWRGMFVDDERVFPQTRRFCRALAARGWLTLSWPRAYGGSEASVWKQAILREEMWAHDEPRGPQYMNSSYIGPCLMRFGTEEQKRRFLPPMARGEVLWTQGFSEPGAGSDLAAIATKAEDRGDHFVLSGQKVWNSYADAPADWCFLLARTDPAAERHRGLSVFLVDMRSPGVTVRPVDSMAGPHELNEIFLDEVVVPADCVLGGPGRGWEVVTAGLGFERVGIARYARAGRLIELLVEHVRSVDPGACDEASPDADRVEENPSSGRVEAPPSAAGEPRGRRAPQPRVGGSLADDPAVRASLADLRVRYEAARLLSYRAISLQATGADARVEASIARLHNAELEQRVAHVGLEILGLAGQLTHDDPHAPLGGLLWRQWVRTIPTTITAGTTEVQKNIVAERGLGLPRPR